MTLYYHCELAEVDGTKRDTAWIEERGAVEGYQVQIPAMGNKWFTVMRVYLATSLTGEQLSEYNSRNRNSLPSIIGN